MDTLHVFHMQKKMRYLKTCSRDSIATAIFLSSLNDTKSFAAY